jgi:predicted Zn-dependent peptidase
MKIIIWLLMAMSVGWLAYKLKKNFFIWFGVSFLISPLGGLALLLVYHYFTKNNPKWFIESINEIYALYKNGIISNQEFEEKKENIIDSLNREKNPENFLFHLIGLSEQNILNHNDIEKIKRKLTNG